MMHWLLVEDEDPKRQKIEKFLLQSFENIYIKHAKSVRSALFSIKEEIPQILFLDISLPTFDISPDESGGRPQGFGGVEVLRYLDKYKVSCPTIVVTGYEAFITDTQKGIELTTLDANLKNVHKNYRGYIYYHSVYEQWKVELAQLINQALRDMENENINS